MMNPETNQFEEVFQEKTDYAKLVDILVRRDGSPVPKEYPVFKIGEEFILKGYKFKVARIDKDELVFTPVGMMSKVKKQKKQSGRAQKKNKRKKRR